MAIDRLTASATFGDDEWLLRSEESDPEAEPAVESIFALVNGYIGTRASRDEGGAHARPGSFIAGVYNRHPEPQEPELEAPISEIVGTPNWCSLSIRVAGTPIGSDQAKLVSQRRTLDLRRGLLRRDWQARDSSGRITDLSSQRFVSLADRHVLVYELAITPTNHDSRIDVEISVDGDVRNRNGVRHLEPFWARRLTSGVQAVARTGQSRVAIAWAARGQLRHPDGSEIPVEDVTTEARAAQRWTWEARQGETYALDWIVAVYTSRDVRDAAPAAEAALTRAADAGHDALLRAHTEAWSDRWSTADVEVTGRPDIQRAARFAAYHLIGSANPGDERASVGARSLTGERYRGHVFWDTELFVWPFHLYTHPETARALLLYRYHTLDAARARARELGYRGALFAWESADTGEETTPAYVRGPKGDRVPVLTGVQEHHIAADVAYAVLQYLAATQDEPFLLDYGAEMLIEIARFWASRMKRDRTGARHIEQVIGPDEYHESVDDNAYTNVLVRHVLRRTVAMTRSFQTKDPDRWSALARALGLTTSELADWGAGASQLVTGFDPQTGFFEQFRGYYRLDDVDLSRHEPLVETLDSKLGWRALRKLKALKQADVVMLLYLLWDEFPPDVRLANYRYYAARCTHDSSLSAAIHALVGARLGEIEPAERLLTQALNIDLDTSHRDAAGAADGVHIASCGGAWQALVFGFAGVYPDDRGLRLRPAAPAEWGTIRASLVWRGSVVRLEIDAKARQIEAAVDGAATVALAIGDGEWREVQPGERIQSRY